MEKAAAGDPRRRAATAGGRPLAGTLYESNPTTADFVVVSPGAWLFRGTGVREGSRFRGLVGTEYDRVNPGYHVERPIQVLSHSRLTCRGIAASRIRRTTPIAAEPASSTPARCAGWSPSAGTATPAWTPPVAPSPDG